MATGKVIGQIQVAQGNVKIVGIDGAVREPNYDGFVYENEQIISDDPTALFQIKFLALPEASAYDGAFRILADGSVIHGRDAIDSVASDESLVNILKTASGEGVQDLKTAGKDIGDLETAAGEEGVVGSSSFTETDIVAESSVLGFSRGANGALGFGITDFGGRAAPDFAHTPPAISSPNVVVYDENGTQPVIQVAASGESAITYSIAGLDSDKFSIDSGTGLLTFNDSPDYENPRDLSGDNEYNIYVTATDTSGYYTTQLLSVSVNNVNEAPTAMNDTVDAVEDTVLSSTIDLDANDTDVDGSALSVVAGTYATAQGGTLVVAADGSYTYTPAANFHGVDTVNYTVTDGEFSNVGTLTINVASVNDAPVAVDDAVSAVEDTVLSSVIDLDANDTDLDGDALSVVAGTFATANGGQLVLASDGTYTYTPAANFNGIDSVNYTVTDGELTDVGTLTINVAAVDDIVTPPANSAPVANVDLGTTAEDGSVVVDILANDTDLDGTIDPTTVVITTNPTNGSISVDALTGAVTYTPNADYNGSDSFAYTVQDNEGATSSPATVSLTVAPVNDAPVANDDAVTTQEDTVLSSVIDLDANDTDLDGDSLSVVAGTFETAQGGEIVIAADGSYTYTPLTNFNGVDTVNYTVTDGSLTDEGTLTINVVSVNDAPVAVDDAVDAVEDTLFTSTIDLDDNDTDVSGDALSVVPGTFATAQGGEIVIAANGSYTYMPAANFNGVDTVNYTVTDGSLSDIGTLTINVAPADDATTLTMTAGTVTEDSAVAGDTVATFSVSDMDETPAVGFTSGTNTNGYYGISGNNIILTSAGETLLDGGGTLPAISLTTSGTSTDMTATATPTTILAADPLIVYSELGTIGNPLFNLADFELGDDPDFVNGVSKSYSSNGLVITSDAPLNFNPGHGLGVDTPTDNTGSEAINIDGRYGEELSIELPSSVFALNIDLKLTGGDLVGIKLYNESGVEITTGISFEKGNGTPLTLTSGGYINGGDLKNGGDTIRIISDVKFDAMDIKDANGSGSQDGFTLVNIYDPMSISGFYTYEYNMDLNLQESNEAVQSVTVSGFDPSIVTKLVFTYDDGTQDEFSSDSTGTITITDSSLLALLSNGDDGDVVVTIASQNEIADSFQPIFDAVTVETSDPSLAVSHTILGGTAGDVLTGEDGNDHIDGRDGSDTINGGSGNDTIVYDIADTEIDGGAGTDTLIANSGVVNLSNISNINIIQLGSSATVVGGVDGINPSDVISATDDGTLIIQSVDNVSNQVNVDTTLFAEAGNIIIDGIEYAQYTGAGATLLIEDTITVD